MRKEDVHGYLRHYNQTWHRQNLDCRRPDEMYYGRSIGLASRSQENNRIPI